MKKLIILLLLSIGMSLRSNSQVLITLQLPQVGIHLKNQLWNMTLVNTGTSTITVKINMLLTDIANNLPVLSASTNLITLPPGVKLIQYNNVVPVTYTVLSGNYGIDTSPQGFLPVGNFEVCFEVLKQLSETFESLAEQCTDIEVEPLSPPHLNTPGDQAEIDETRPLFTWLPPAPLSLFSGLTYELKLVEVLPNQTAPGAVEENLPILSEQNITGLNYQYPFSTVALDTGKTYAWQITANNNGLYVAKSEVWTFSEKVFGMDNTVYQQDGAYFRLQKELSSAYYLSNELLKFAYEEEAGDSILPIKIYDITNESKVVVNLDTGYVILERGLNLLKINLGENGGFSSGHLYLLELANSRKEIFYGRFKYRPNNN